MELFNWDRLEESFNKRFGQLRPSLDAATKAIQALDKQVATLEEAVRELTSALKEHRAK